MLATGEVGARVVGAKAGGAAPRMPRRVPDSPSVSLQIAKPKPQRDT